MKTTEYVKPEDLEWTCGKCNEPLVVGPVKAAYMGNEFTADLPHCPRCGMVLISEDLALGAMAEVEQILEDK
jgi:ribosomal protein S27AE